MAGTGNSQVQVFFGVLGRPKLQDGDGVAIELRSRKALALLGFLVRCPERSIPRRRVANILWSTSDEHKAATSLRQCLRLIKRAAGRPVIETSRTDIQLIAGAVRLDLEDLMAALDVPARTAPGELKALWRGPFLDGCETLDPEFSAWLDSERDAIAAQVCDKILTGIAPLITDHGPDLDRIGELARLVLTVDPHHEQGHELLAVVHQSQGRPDLAAKQRSAMRRAAGEPIDDADVTVSPLLRRIASGNGSFSSRRDAIGRPQVIVATDKGSNQMADSFQDALLCQFSRHRRYELFVHEESASAKIRHQDFGDYRLGFRSDAHTNRLFIEVIELSSGRVHYFDYVELETLADLEHFDAMISRVVNRVNVNIQARGGQSAADQKTPYELCNLAISLIREFRPESDDAAHDLLQPLAEKDVNFSLVYSALASINIKRRTQNRHSVDDGETAERSLDLARRSLRLDPFEVYNHLIHGWALFHAGHWQDGLVEFDEALALNPIDPFTAMAVAEANGFAGNIDKAFQLSDMAYRLTARQPRYFHGYLATIEFAAGHYEACLESCAKAPFANMEVLALQIAALMKTKRPDLAKANLQRLKAMTSISQPDHLAVWLRQLNMFTAPKPRDLFFSCFRKLGVRIPAVAPG